MSFSWWSPHRLFITLEDAQQSREFVIDKPFALLGSAAGCDVRLPADGPRRCFALLADTNGLRGAALIPRQHTVRRPFRRIEPNQSIRLGETTLRVTVEGPRAVGESENDLTTGDSPWMISWLDGDRLRYLHVASRRPLLIGRYWPAQLRVDDRSLSAAHALLYRDEARLWVIDLASRRGVWPGNQRQSQIVLDGPADFRLGDVTFRALSTSPPSAAKSVADRSVINRSAIDDEIAAQRQEIDALSAVITQLTTQRDELTLHVHELDQRRLQQQSQTEQAMLELDRLQQAHATADEALRAAYQDLRAERERAQQEQVSSDRKLQERERDLDRRMRDMVEHFEIERAELRSAAERTAQALRDEQEAVEQEKGELALREAELEHRRRQFEAEQSHYESLILELKRQLRESRQTIAEHRRQQELALVNRLRTQRALRERESAIVQQLAELQQRAQALDDQETALRLLQREFSDLRRRDLSVDDLLTRLSVRDALHITSVFEADLLEGSPEDEKSFLAKPEFVDLLDQVLERQDDDSSLNGLH